MINHPIDGVRDLIQYGLRAIARSIVNYDDFFALDRRCAHCLDNFFDCRPFVVARNDYRDFQLTGGWNPKSARNFSKSQSANESFFIVAAFCAMRVSALSTLPFKQYRYASRKMSLATRSPRSFSFSNNWIALSKFLCASAPAIKSGVTSTGGVAEALATRSAIDTRKASLPKTSRTGIRSRECRR